MTQGCGHNACDEYNRLSRRQFIGLAGGVVSAVGFSALVRAADPNARGESAGDSPERDTMVAIFLRGGIDGLAAVVPYPEDYLYQVRPNLAVARPGVGPVAQQVIDLDGYFGFHPALAALMPVWRRGHLLAVHACGFEETSRSHFDAQRWMETGKVNDLSLDTGWLGRHMQAVGGLTVPLRGVGLGAGLPRSMVGAPKSMPLNNNAGVAMGDGPTLAERLLVLRDFYAGSTDALVGPAGLSSLDALGALTQVPLGRYVAAPGVVYTNSALGGSLRSAAAMIKAGVGIEAITLDATGWDTHANQGSVNPNGTLFMLLKDLAQNLSAFYFDMDGSRFTYTAAVFSEFGRNIRENGSLGTDHGHGGVMFAMGPKILGGRVLTDWPGITPAEQFEGQDLAATIDYRDVLAEILQKRLLNRDLSQVFPGFTPTFRNVVAS